MSKVKIDEVIDALFDIMADMNDDERRDVINKLAEKYCIYCGSGYLPCYCWNDD